MDTPASRKLYWCKCGVVGADAARLGAVLTDYVIAEWGGREDDTPLLVLFTQPSDELYELVHRVSRRGEQVVVAVAWGQRLAGVVGWALLDAGAEDVLSGDDPIQLAGQIAARVRHRQAVDDRLRDEAVRGRCVGGSQAWRRSLRELVEASAEATAPVLLQGESGTGKEVVARLLHALGGAGGPLVTVDCTTIVRELSGSELFGHVRGAFTGAHADREGAFAAANGGTLFLDEVGDLPPALQPELLRVVQEGTYKAVGSNVWHRTAFRLVAATHRDLTRETAEGRFRLDLYHRLSGWTVRLPPLRDRVEDIPDLVNHFLREFAPAAALELSGEVWDFLLNRPYPGNVRELKNLVRRLVLRRGGAGRLTLGAVAPEDRPKSGDDTFGWLRELEAAADKALARGVTLKNMANHARECLVRAAVRREGGSLQRAAKRLGVTDRALQIRAAGKRGAAEGE